MSDATSNHINHTGEYVVMGHNRLVKHNSHHSNVHVYVMLVPMILMLCLVVGGWTAPRAQAAARLAEGKGVGLHQAGKTVSPPQQRTCRDLTFQMNYTPT